MRIAVSLKWHICLDVTVAAENRLCTVSLSGEPQHIVGGGRSNAVSCGVETQPWSVEALTGQRIAVSLINFGRYNDNYC